MRDVPSTQIMKLDDSHSMSQKKLQNQLSSIKSLEPSGHGLAFEIALSNIDIQPQTLNNELPTNIVPITPNFIEDFAQAKAPNYIASTSETSLQNLDEDVTTKDSEKISNLTTSSPPSQQKEPIHDNILDAPQEISKPKSAIISDEQADVIFQNYQPALKKEPKYVSNYAKPLKRKGKGKK